MVFMGENTDMKGISLEITTALPTLLNDQQVKALVYR
jgi:hypothetical protein